MVRLRSPPGMPPLAPRGPPASWSPASTSPAWSPGVRCRARRRYSATAGCRVPTFPSTGIRIGDTAGGIAPPRRLPCTRGGQPCRLEGDRGPSALRNAGLASTARTCEARPRLCRCRPTASSRQRRRHWMRNARRYITAPASTACGRGIPRLRADPDLNLALCGYRARGGQPGVVAAGPRRDCGGPLWRMAPPPPTGQNGRARVGGNPASIRAQR